MAKPINHDTGSSLVTGAWESSKGAVAAAAFLPLAAAITLGGIGLAVGLAVGFASSGIIAAVGLGMLGAATGGLGGATLAVTVGAPITAGLAALGGLLGLKRGADKVSKEKAAFVSRVMEHENKINQDQTNAMAAGLQQGYQAGFQEGQQFAVQQIQRELQEQAAQQQKAAQQPDPIPDDGYVAKEKLRRGGQQLSAISPEAILQQKEQAASAERQQG